MNTEPQDNVVRYDDLSDEDWSNIQNLILYYQYQIQKDIVKVLKADEKNVGLIIPFVLAGISSSLAHNSGNSEVFMDIFNTRFEFVMKGLNGEEGGCNITIIEDT